MNSAIPERPARMPLHHNIRIATVARATMPLPVCISFFPADARHRTVHRQRAAKVGDADHQAQRAERRDVETKTLLHDERAHLLQRHRGGETQPADAGRPKKSRPLQDGEVGSRHRRARPAIAARLQWQRRHQRQNGQTGGTHQDEAHLPVRILAEQAADELTAAQRGDKSDREHRQPPRQLVTAPVIPHDDACNDRRATGTHTLQRAQRQQLGAVAAQRQQPAAANEKQQGKRQRRSAAKAIGSRAPRTAPARQRR